MNIFENIPDTLNGEIFTTLLESKDVKIERIVSDGQTSKEWYDQEQNEWILLLQGNAIIEFEDRSIELKSGDTLNIPFHVKHKVAYTSNAPKCIWLALFY